MYICNVPNQITIFPKKNMFDVWKPTQNAIMLIVITKSEPIKSIRARISNLKTKKKHFCV